MSLDLRWILTSCQTHLIISGQVSEDQLVSCWILTLTSLQLDRVTKDKSVKMTYLLTCRILTSPQTYRVTSAMPARMNYLGGFYLPAKRTWSPQVSEDELVAGF